MWPGEMVAVPLRYEHILTFVPGGGERITQREPLGAAPVVDAVVAVAPVAGTVRGAPVADTCCSDRCGSQPGRATATTKRATTSTATAASTRNRTGSVADDRRSFGPARSPSRRAHCRTSVGRCAGSAASADARCRTTASALRTPAARTAATASAPTASPNPATGGSVPVRQKYASAPSEYTSARASRGSRGA